MYRQPWGKDAVDTADSFVSPFTFKTGRLECSTSPNSTQMDNFPTPFMTHAEVLDYFAAEFDMTPNEVILLFSQKKICEIQIRAYSFSDRGHYGCSYHRQNEGVQLGMAGMKKTGKRFS